MLSRIFLVFFFSLVTLNQAMALTISPDKPVVAIGQRITLTANGATGNVRWQAFDGAITGSGNQITYIAPDKAGLDFITIRDDSSSQTINIVITQPQTELKVENAQWEVFTNRSYILALLLSEDNKTLWVGTNGGLEKRNAETGEIKQVFLNTDGLPSNTVTSLLSDGKGGIWVGTKDGGLVYLDINGKWTIFNKDNSGLPANWIRSLLNDGNEGIWIGTEYGGLAHLDINGKWTIFNRDNSGLPANSITNLLNDGNGGIWIGTEYGLTHLDVNGKWTIFNRDNSGLPDSWIYSLLIDGKGGIWIGTVLGGLVHYDVNRKWTVFNKDNSNLPNNSVWSLLSDGNRGILMLSGGALTHLDINEKWTILNKDNAGLPDNNIISLLSDGNGGIWIGTFSSGLLHFDSIGMLSNHINSGLPDNSIYSLLGNEDEALWIGTSHGLAYYDVNKRTISNKDSSALYNDWITSLAKDNEGEIWVGTREGLAHFNSSGKWTIFNDTNLKLPNNEITFLLSNEQGRVWIGTPSGLAHFDITSRNLTIFNKDNSELPDNKINILLDDKNGGIWIGTDGGLAHFDSTERWTVFVNTFKYDDVLPLPSNFINSLSNDGEGGIWIGTNYGGLAHLDKSGKSTFFSKSNSELPDNEVVGLSIDGNGGLWIGTPSGLAYLDINKKWTIFNKGNSGLPDNSIKSLLNDSKGGLWVGTHEGLAHLTFTNKTALCQQTTQQNCSALQNNKRGAIIIAGGGSDSSNTLWETTRNVSNTIYGTLSKRGFDNNEIYYLSPVDWADFNGDGINDRIVDAPKADRAIESGDIQKALEWAKQQGKLNQPLYIFFVDHGGTDKFQLSQYDTLPVETFKQMLDDYQTATTNEIVLVIDACFSGVLGEKLKADKRAIITSTSNSYAYFNRLDQQGFSTFLTKGLSKGMNFNEAFSYATTEQKKLLDNLGLRVVVTGSTGSNSGEIEQVPRKFDGNQTYSLDKLFLNGSFVTGDSTLAVRNITTSTQTKANIPFNLKAQASVALGSVKEVWAVVRPPRMDLILDSYNTPILAFPRVILSPTNVNNEWEGTLSNTRYNGDYKITFYAKDKDGDVVSSDETITLTVFDGIEPPPQANLQIQLNQASYKAGDLFKATITEELQWGYDLYVAVILPSGDFITLKEQNGFSNLNEIKTWYGNRSQGISNPFLELTLPALPAGQYCLFGALSPEGEPPLNAQKYWKQTTQCFIMN